MLLDVRDKPHDANRLGCGVGFEGSNPIHRGQTAGVEIQKDGLRLSLGEGRWTAPWVTHNHFNTNDFCGFPNLRQEEEVIHQGYYGRCHDIALPGTGNLR